MGKHTNVAHDVPGPAGVPPAAVQLAGVRFTQPPVEAKQHAWVGCGQLTLAHMVLSPWYTPPAATQAACVLMLHEPSGKQQAPAAGWQFTDSQVARMTQSPEGWQ
jgi:hypothetical protein